MIKAIIAFLRGSSDAKFDTSPKILLGDHAGAFDGNLECTRLHMDGHALREGGWGR